MFNLSKDIKLGSDVAFNKTSFNLTDWINSLGKNYIYTISHSLSGLNVFPVIVTGGRGRPSVYRSDQVDPSLNPQGVTHEVTNNVVWLNAYYRFQALRMNIIDQHGDVDRAYNEIVFLLHIEKAYLLWWIS